MPSCPRSQVIAPNEPGVYHCYNRCVRRAFLCGVDSVTGQSFEHRKEWIQLRLELLAVSFGIEVCDFALLDNHIHLILRTRPEIVAAWDDREVALRWWRICPTRRDERGEAPEPLPCELNLWLDDRKQMTELRGRLSSISWFMRLLCQKIARMANDEDQIRGKFWESRFKAQPLLDEQAVLACSMYVNLNPIRAGKAQTPEESRFTSVYERILAMKRARMAAAGSAASGNGAPQSAECDLWICKLELTDRFLDAGIEATEPGNGVTPGQVNAFPSRRLTNKGYLRMSEEQYLSLLDWTGRQIRGDMCGSIPANLAPILDRLGLNAAKLPELVSGFAKTFHSAVGRVDSMMAFAQRIGRRWIAGVRQAAVAFASAS
jgi:REP element-mobilizing transposase RayT